MKIPKSEIERLVEKLHDEANKYREYEITKDEIRSILCANVTALEEIVRLAHFLAFPPEPAPPVAERGETRERPKTDPIALARRTLRSIEDNPTAGFRCEVLKEHAILLCRTVLSADKALEDLRERCAKICDDRADAIAVCIKPAPSAPFSTVSEYLESEHRSATSFREQTVRDCAEAIRALPLTPDAPSKP